MIDLVKNHQLLITLEEGAIGGFGSVIAKFLHDSAVLDNSKCKFSQMVMADQFIEQNKIETMQDQAGIGVEAIVNLIKEQILK